MRNVPLPSMHPARLFRVPHALQKLYIEKFASNLSRQLVRSSREDCLLIFGRPKPLTAIGFQRHFVSPCPEYALIGFVNRGRSCTMTPRALPTLFTVISTDPSVYQSLHDERPLDIIVRPLELCKLAGMRRRTILALDGCTTMQIIAKGHAGALKEARLQSEKVLNQSAQN